ncbi:hypothetical protein PM082_023953 [Marasmius tenuissimus]|nr:hypothetical protein PM082_023953 [Marasmius tenuissimus]
MCTTSKTLSANTLCDPTDCTLEGITSNYANGDLWSTINATNYQCSSPITGNSFQGVVVHGTFTNLSGPTRDPSHRTGRNPREAASSRFTHEEAAGCSRNTERDPSQSPLFSLDDFPSCLIQLIQVVVSPLAFVT